MACNIATQRKRLAFEKLDDEAAPCRAARGFANIGSMPKYYWAMPDTLQVAPQWIFLNNGVVMQAGSVVGSSFQFTYAQLTPPASVLQSFNGFNDVQFRPSDAQPYTVFLAVNIGGTAFTPGPVAFSEISGRIDFAPDPRDSFYVAAFQTPGSPPTPGTFVGGITFTPLKQCHDCVTGP